MTPFNRIICFSSHLFSCLARNRRLSRFVVVSAYEDANEFDKSTEATKYNRTELNRIASSLVTSANYNGVGNRKKQCDNPPPKVPLTDEIQQQKIANTHQLMPRKISYKYPFVASHVLQSITHCAIATVGKIKESLSCGSFFCGFDKCSLREYEIDCKRILSFA